MTIDQAVESYEQSIEDAINQFVEDTQELEDEGLSTAEILAIIAAIDITSYFIEELQFAAAQNAYMAATETILADLPFFGVATEQQLLALQNIQRFNIEGLTRHVTANMQASMAQGIASKLDRGPMAELMRSNIKTTIPRVENIIGTQLGNYRRAIIMQMAVDLPASSLYDYIGPRDEKNRPVCRQFLDSSPLTEQEIRSIKADAMETGGGINCRHFWYPIDV
tara:strand:+ start:102 stop:770 length:669 start_codon:yes stop_codon:yes gene_type:complete